MMSEKAYAGDIIRVTKEIVGRAKVGEIHVVDMRQSDMGACDDVALVTETELVLYDDEYELVEKLSIHHSRTILNAYLSESNDKLLSKFKWGSEGSGEFGKFMRALREVLNK